MSAQADDQSAQAYTQKCTDIGNGTLCIDITGTAGSNGAIGVGYWKHAGGAVEVRVGWRNTGGGGYNMDGTHHYLGAGGTTGTRVWNTYLAKECVYPVLEVFGGQSQVIHGEQACTPG
ncbi:hypothetical protein ACWGJ2_00595 [Streptomyces sp. NPDC054796]